MANKKSGYLRYKCGCGAIIKVETNDLFHALNNNLPASSRPQIHECDEKRLGVAVLVGGTFHTDEDEG